jgi:hypothetical protein
MLRVLGKFGANAGIVDAAGKTVSKISKALQWLNGFAVSNGA